VTEPYYERDGITIYHGDCREVLPTLAAGSVELVLTDPPYGMNNDCDYTRFVRGTHGHGSSSSRRYDPIMGDDQPFDPAPWRDFPRVVLWRWNHFAGRLPVGTTLIWLKRFDGGFGSFLSDAEIAWMKGGQGVYAHRDTSLMRETHRRRHPTEKPVGLMRWCLQRAGGQGLILDPFMGSGPVLRAAADMGRRAIGIEIEERYCEIAARRLAQGVLPLEAAGD
jgi:site-specific DNA-methyltransferase (adenine-specific)